MPDRPPSELLGLTGLRGIAALTVFIAHGKFYEMVPGLRPLLVFFEWHSLAVDLFFMLSGFVLVHVYAKKFAAGTRPFWKPYFSARFARIVPLYLATLLACLGIFGAGSLLLGRWPAHLAWQIVVTNLLLLQGWPGLFHQSINIPSWSLSVEVFCYLLVMPLAFVLHRRLPRAGSLVLMALLLVAWRFASSSVGSGWIGLERGITGFLIGALLHQFYTPIPGRTRVAMTLVAAAAFVILQSLVAWGGFSSFLPVFTFPFLIQGLAGSAGSLVHRIFSSPLMLWLGDVSYSTYLWQGPVFLAAHSVVRPRLAGMPSYVCVAWILCEFFFTLWISHLSYHKLEMPMRRWLRF